MPRTKKIKEVIEPEIVEDSSVDESIESLKELITDKSIEKPKKVKEIKVIDDDKIEKKKLFQQRKQERFTKLVEEKAMMLLEQKEKNEAPIVEEEIIILKKNRKPKQKKTIYIDETEDVEEYVYKNTNPSIPVKVTYW
jgi:hypothetical protein